MPDRPEDYAPIAARPWREPYDLLLAFAETESADERDRLRPRVRGACRELKRRLWFYRHSGWAPELSRPVVTTKASALRDFDKKPDSAVLDLLVKAAGNNAIDEDSRQRIIAVAKQLARHLESSD
jgi:hypothetical protein